MVVVVVVVVPVVFIDHRLLEKPLFMGRPCLNCAFWRCGFPSSSTWRASKVSTRRQQDALEGTLLPGYVGCLDEVLFLRKEVYIQTTWKRIFNLRNG